MEKDEMTIDLSEIFAILKKRLKLILTITILSTIISGLVSFFVITPVYEAKVSIIIGKAEGDTSAINYNDLLMYSKLVKTYSAIAKLDSVADDTIKSLNLDKKPSELLKMIIVTPQADTQILDIKVRSTDKTEAYDIANAHAKSFIKKGEELIPTGSVNVLDKPQYPEFPVKPNKKLNIAIAFVLGFMVSAGIAFLLEFLDKTVKDEKQLEAMLNLPVIGVIPIKTNEKN